MVDAACGRRSPRLEARLAPSFPPLLSCSSSCSCSCSSSCLQPWDGANVSVTPQPPPRVALQGHGAKRSGTHGAAPTARGRGKIGREGLRAHLANRVPALLFFFFLLTERQQQSREEVPRAIGAHHRAPGAGKVTLGCAEHQPLAAVALHEGSG